MEKNDFKDVNQFKLRGPIVKIKKNDIATNIILKIPRINSKTGVVEFSYPEVSLYKNIKNKADDLKEGMVIEVFGTIHPKKKTIEETGENIYYLTLICNEIKIANKILYNAFGLDEGPYEESFNEIKLIGMISNIVKLGQNINRVNIQTYVNGNLDNLQVLIFGKNLDLKHGDKICAVAEIETIWKDKNDGNRINYKNIIVKAYSKLK